MSILFRFIMQSSGAYFWQFTCRFIAYFLENCLILVGVPLSTLFTLGTSKRKDYLETHDVTKHLQVLNHSWLQYTKICSEIKECSLFNSVYQWVYLYNIETEGLTAIVKSWILEREFISSVNIVICSWTKFNITLMIL